MIPLILKNKLQQFEQELNPFAFSKQEVIRLFEISLLIKGHILIEDLPGTGKTTLSKAFAKILGREFARIQGTSDLLPQDIIGGEIIDFNTKEFRLKKGPIFSDFVLIDEVNRMHPKSQSAFLQAMEEKQVSINGNLFDLPAIHMIIATQNPIEYSGTYPLPEAQRDRFACVLKIGFPQAEIQKNILAKQTYIDLSEQIKNIPVIFTEEDIFTLQELVKQVTISDNILERLLKLTEWTRDPIMFRYGLTPRGLGILASALRANALLENRNFVIPEDGINLVIPFLKHRIEYLDESINNDNLAIEIAKEYQELFKGM